MNSIGLFPLGVVLFPESSIQLHIFEDRYKNLINDCMNNNIVFGVNLTISSKIQNVGCTARVTKLLHKYPDGSMDIIVKGISRYHLIDYKRGIRQYLTGDIQYDEDNREYPKSDLLNGCIEIYNMIADEVKSMKIDKIDTNQLFTKTPSYFIAQKAGLTSEQKYKLLESDSENDRLKYLLDHLKRIEPVLRESEYINQIIKYDGYLKEF